MRIFRITSAGLIATVLGGLAWILAFNDPANPPPLASVNDPFREVDFGDLPPVQTYAARDGTALGYRIYPGGKEQVVILIHGSSDDGGGMHKLAKALRDAGASVYVPVIRGHYKSGRSGDIDYAGQLGDDLADFVAAIRPLYPEAGFSLIGFSSGGGFTLRMLAGPEEKLFDRFIMISPALPPGAPTMRPDAGGWVGLALPRIILLSILNRIGIDRFNNLPIIAFAISPKAYFLTGVYSYRLALDFAAPRDYRAALGRSTKPAALLVGGMDELLVADQFAPLLGPVRPDMKITLVPGIGHIGMVVSPDGIAAIRKSFLELISAGGEAAGK